MISPHIKFQIESLEKRLKVLPNDGLKIALFDLDNTLIVGDIGEAVFARLLADGKKLGCTWGEYEAFLRSDQTAAYRFIVEAMEGLSIKEVEEATVRVLNQHEPVIAVEGKQVPVPRIHRGMRELVFYLREIGYTDYIISASNQIAVRIVAADFFAIPAERAFGIEMKTCDGVLTSSLIKPFPISSGKQDVFRKRVGNFRPFITATDSMIDAPMLALTDPSGLSLWVGKNRREFKRVQERLQLPQQCCFVQRPQSYSLRKRVRILGEQWRTAHPSSPLLTET
ncbi:MAG TPA: HAD family hydrolase [Bacteroidota bacterium]|nr:HAD family hydrolase [Bacteroidota bacterium]